ncbi:MAG TPA: hypothetical protein VKX16_11940 [Chloroflexota bacterium]|nr:hypothetical protein [Chloroflexota bacterium]
MTKATAHKKVHPSPAPSAPVAPEAATTTTEAVLAATTAARVIRDFWFKHRGNDTVHTPYKAGAIVVGDEASELLDSGCPHVCALGAETGFQLCHSIDCGARVSNAAIRAGECVCAEAHQAVTALRCMYGVSHVAVRPGELIELVYANHIARFLIEDAAPGSVCESGMAVYKAACPKCGSAGLFAVPRIARGVARLSRIGGERK